MRRSSPAFIWASLLAAPGLALAAGFDCQITLDSNKYDLRDLAGVQSVSHDWDTPPSKTADHFRWNLCADLDKQEDIAEADQCGSGTRVCLTRTNRKGDEKDRIVAAIPIARTEDLAPEYSELKTNEGLSLIFHGPSYPSTNSTPVAQSAAFTLLCSTTSSDPKFVSYDGSRLELEWSSPAACVSTGSKPPKNDDTEPAPKSSRGSGIGWFFLAILLMCIAYFGLGAYYNYSTYGASGSDLIPHRDFWREVPYMLRDVVAHLYSTFRGSRHSSNRGGYISV